ncbi:MAG: helix-turn-helix domain-containing protein [Alphaproteobacteria bacterium]
MATSAYIHTHAAAAGSQWCVGSALRSAREAGGESLEDIADVLRFRVDYLSAMEEENYGLLPGWAYVLGYVRAYAEYLGLEPAPLVKKVREQLALRQHMFQAERSQRLVSPRTLTASAGVAAILAIVVGVFVTDPAKEFGRILAPVSASLKFVVAKSTDLLAGGGAVAQTDVRPAGARAAPTPQVAKTRVAQAPVAKVTAGKTPLPDIWGKVQALSMMPVPPQNGARILVRTHPRGTIDRFALAPQVLVLRATKPVTVQIHDDSGQTILDRELKTGELYRTTQGANIRISTPDAGAVEVYVNGKPAGTLGKPGQALVRAWLKTPPPSG